MRRHTLGHMSGDPRQKLSRDEGLAALEGLWGPPADTHEQRKADAWARRTLGLAPYGGDEPLLTEVDADLAMKYGLRSSA